MKYDRINGQDFYNMVVNASNRLLEESDFVNALNVFPVPDGDTGSNMSMTFKAAVKEIENLNSESIGETSKKLAKGALMGARGNSGVILSQILRGISKGLEGKTTVNSTEFANAFLEGSKAAYKAVMKPTEGTILSVIRAAAEGAVRSNKTDIVELLGEVVVESKIMLDKTPDLLPALKKAKVVDSGGMGLYIILQGMYDALKDGIKAEIKDVRFYIVGKDPVDEVKALQSDDVIVTGMVDDVKEYYSLADLVVLPLKNGGGVKVKLLEAISFNKPIVSTTVGVEGTYYASNLIPISDESQGFSKLCKEMILEKEKYPTKEVFEYYENNYTWIGIGRKYRNCLEQIVNGG